MAEIVGHCVAREGAQVRAYVEGQLVAASVGPLVPLGPVDARGFGLHLMAGFSGRARRASLGRITSIDGLLGAPPSTPVCMGDYEYGVYQVAATIVAPDGTESEPGPLGAFFANNAPRPIAASTLSESDGVLTMHVELQQ